MRSTILRKSGNYLIFLFTGVLVGISLLGTAFAKDLKLGYYDLNYLKSELPFFQKLADINKAKDMELEVYRGNLYKDYLKFYQTKLESSNQEKLGKSAAEQTQINERFQTELNSRIKEMNDQLEKKRFQVEVYKTEQSQIVNNKIIELVNTISRKKKFDFMIDKDFILYGGTDITQDIIKQAKKDEQKNKTQ